MRGPFVAIAVMAVLLALTGSISPRDAQALAKPIYVDITAAGANDGTSWEDAYNNLGVALLANPGRTFFVAQGTYKPFTLPFGEIRDYHFALTPGQKIQGGYRGGPTDPGAHDPSQYHTLLSGERGGPGKSDNHRTVLSFNLAGDEVASIRDVEITGGYEERAGVDGGGIVSTDGMPEIHSSRIHDNYSYDFGGGVTVQGGGLLLEGSEVTDNSTSLGATNIAAGVFLGTLSAAARIIGVEISHSGAGVDAGGFLLAKGHGTLEVIGSAFGGPPPSDAGQPVSGVSLGTGKSSFTDSLFMYLGTAVFVDGDDTVISRTALYQSDAGLVNSTASGNVFVDDSSIVGSDAPLFNRGVMELRSATLVNNGGETSPVAPRLINSISWDSAGNVPPATPAIFEHSIIDTPAACGTAITCSDVSFDDPLVGPPGDWGGPNLSVPLGFGSPAVDAGFAAECGAYDQRNFPRPVDGDGNGTTACDIGAFELDPPTIAFAAATSTVREAPVARTLVLRRTGVLLSDETVIVEPFGGSAIPGTDYRFAPLTVTVKSDLPVLGDEAIRAARASYGLRYTDTTGPVDEKFVQFTVRIVDDFLVEPAETLRLRLSNATEMLIGEPAEHTLTITDDEPRLKCAGTAATIVGSPGNDLLVGTDNRDVIVARGGDDRIRALGGSDRVCGGPGNDTVRAGAGADVAFGHGGEDTLAGGGGNDELRGGGGNDALNGGGGNDTLLGNLGADKLAAGTGHDRLAGGPGDGDECNGGAGTDSLLPGAGCETVVGVP